MISQMRSWLPMVLLLVPIEQTFGDPGGDGGGGGTEKRCYYTEVGPKCGADVVYSHAQCGNPPSTCVLYEVSYELLLRCKSDDLGLGLWEGCTEKWCRAQHIYRECVEGQCLLDHITYENAAKGSIAWGELCPALL
ncbi:hypothetical protein RAS1_01440 [Phycisphaerae bacterium RAS1]|nr:hypothetical protein RAS1_01440 [Phycisphaerae bacterium RAS1]